MATWYVRSGGSDLNAGSTDSNTADQSGSAGVVVTATLTEVGAFAAAAATGVINLQVAGASEIRTYTKVNDDSITLDSAPSAGNGTYAWKIGGARATIAKVIDTGTGNNAKLADNDIVFLQGSTTFTENALTPAKSLFIRGNGTEATIDGTGGAAGSDCWANNGKTTTFVMVKFANAVDDGLTGTGTVTLLRCHITGCGDDGCNVTNVNWAYTASYSNTGDGGDNTAGGTHSISNSHFDSNTASGYRKALIPSTGFLDDSLFTRNGTSGIINFNGANSVGRGITGCTFEGNTGAGMILDAVTNLTAGAIVLNNIFSNNTTYGVNSSAGAQTNAAFCSINYNDYYGNTTADRNNFTTGAQDIATDPGFTARSTGDFSLLSTGAAYKSGYSPYVNPTLNKVNMGAVPGPGSTETYIYTTAQGGGGLLGTYM